MSLFWLAAVYALLVLLAGLAGGSVPLVVRLTHTRMQVALSFVAGVMLGIGLLHLVPHGYMTIGNIDQTVWWTLGGFLVMFFLERFFHFHHHDAPVPDPPGDVADDGTTPLQLGSHLHSHAQDHHHHPSSPMNLSWSGALLGLTLHSLTDGIALGAAMQVEAAEGHGVGLAGFGTFLAVVLHKPFDSLTIGTLMAAGGWSRRWRHIVNLLYALIAPLGLLAFFLGIHRVEAAYPDAVGFALCFAAGAFLCIAASDLLPEVQFHRHDRIKLSVALLLGVALAAAIVLVETSGHEHHEHETGPHVHETSS